ncbi:Protein of unknown function [Gryllus bimaculatus]|nr:Protein of unknown function [Gryllus bimaculatus]
MDTELEDKASVSGLRYGQANLDPTKAVMRSQSVRSGTKGKRLWLDPTCKRGGEPPLGAEARCARAAWAAETRGAPCRPGARGRGGQRAPNEDVRRPGAHLRRIIEVGQGPPLMCMILSAVLPTFLAHCMCSRRRVDWSVNTARMRRGGKSRCGGKCGQKLQGKFAGWGRSVSWSSIAQRNGSGNGSALAFGCLEGPLGETQLYERAPPQQMMLLASNKRGPALTRISAKAPEERRDIEEQGLSVVMSREKATNLRTNW